jgi:hypothetical protein
MINDFRFAFRQLWKAPARFSLLMTAAFLATWLSARRATKISPMEALRTRMKFHASCRAAHTAAATENQLC